MTTETYAIESLIFKSGDSLGALLMLGTGGPYSDSTPEYIDLPPGVPMTVGGSTCDESGLLAWFRRSKGVHVEFDRDPRRYGLVTAARFTAH